MITQKFKGVMLSRTKCVNNILKTYALSEKRERNDWYGVARHLARQLAHDRPYYASQCAGVMAALSPLKTWEENLDIAYDFIEHGIMSHTYLFVNKAERIMNCDGGTATICSILNGRKITAFFLNIMGDNNTVTIDRHALSIALGRDTYDHDYRGMTARQYAFFQECYVIAATKERIKPSLMQSTTWQTYRRLKI